MKKHLLKSRKQKERIMAGKKAAVFNVDGSIYSLGVIKMAAHIFSGTCRVRISRRAKNTFTVSLMPKGAEKACATEEDFCNELLNISVRKDVAKENRQIREYIVAKALFAAIGGDGADKKNGSRASARSHARFEEDPLGIAVPWEEKYGKKR